MTRLLTLPFLLVAALAAAPAFADDDRAAKREQFCQDNPATCEKRREERAEKKQWCQENPAECQKLKDERKARHEKKREACKANPEECKERREDRRERRSGNP